MTRNLTGSGRELVLSGTLIAVYVGARTTAVVLAAAQRLIV